LRKRILIVTLVLLFLLSTLAAVAGCSKKEAAPAKAAQSSEVKQQKWRYQSIWVPSITLWRPDKYFGDLVNVLTGGELEIQYFEGGKLITKSDEIFDAVSKGTLDMATDWPSYWEGKNTAFSLITSVPMGFTPADYMIWYWQGGGLELAQELYAKYGIVWFPHSVTGPESGQRSNVPIKTADDYKNVKMRQCGRTQAKILQDLGGAAIFMPGAEVYMSLQRGTIDAAEFSVPEVDWSMGLQEVTKYWVLPGWHQPGPISGVMISKKSWDKLSDKAKFMFKEAAMATMMWSWTYWEYGSGEYTQKFKQAGTTVTRLDDPAIDKVQDLAWKLIVEDAEKNPDHAKIAFSQVRFFKNMAEWRNIQAPFMYGRTPKGLDDTYTKLEAIAKKHGVHDAVIALEKSNRARMEKQEFWKPGTQYVANPVPIK